MLVRTRTGSFEIRPYRPGDERAILAAWKEAFGKEMRLEEWQWKYAQNPEGFRCLLCLAEDGTVAVHYAAQVQRLAWGGEEILGLHLTDSFSHPRFRWALGGKTGLFVRTGRIFLKTYLEKIDFEETPLPTEEPLAQFHYGFPGERHFKLGIKLLKYRPHQPGVLYLEGEPPRKEPRFLWLYDVEEASLGEGPSWAALDAFFEDFKRRFPTFSIVRNRSFLGWRFMRPHKTYKIFYLKTFWRKKLKAWIIISAEKERLKILDFLALEEKDLALLLNYVLFTHRKKAQVWLAGNHPLKKAFKAPFSPAPEPLGIIPNTGCDFAQSHWRFEDGDLFFFTMADADLF